MWAASGRRGWRCAWLLTSPHQPAHAGGPAPRGLDVTLCAGLAETVSAVQDALTDQCFRAEMVRVGIDLVPVVLEGRADEVTLVASLSPSAFDGLPASRPASSTVRCVLVVRELTARRCLVEAQDPESMAELCAEDIRHTAAEARYRLCEALASLVDDLPPQSHPGP